MPPLRDPQYDLIQKSKYDLRIYSSFLAEVSTLTRNHELFLGPFGFIEKILTHPSWVDLMLGFEHPHFNFL